VSPHDISFGFSFLPAVLISWAYIVLSQPDFLRIRSGPGWGTRFLAEEKTSLASQGKRRTNFHSCGSFDCAPSVLRSGWQLL